MALSGTIRLMTASNRLCICFFKIGLPLLFLSCERFSLLVEEKKDEAVLATYDFETEIGHWNEEILCCSWSANLSDSVSRVGVRSLRFELRQGDLVSQEPRSEVGYVPQKNREGWFGFSILFPANFAPDSLEEFVAKWQTVPDFDIGEAWRSPPLQIGVLHDSLILEVRSDNKKITKQGDYFFERFNLGPLKTGVWIDWVFHINWAYDNTGSIVVWKDGKVVFSRIGKPNSYNDSQYPYFQIGLDKFGWVKNKITSINRRVIYIDQVSIGNEKATYQKVHPGRL